MLGFSVAVVLFPLQSSRANQWGQDIDFQGYCNYRAQVAYSSDHKVTASLQQRKPFGNNAFDWQCNYFVEDIRNRSTRTVKGDVDANKACKLQYGNSFFARVGDRNNPFSWYCTRN